MFIIAIIAAGITYTVYNMEQISQATETIEIKQTIDLQKTTEEFDVVKVEKVNSEFSITVSNTGDIPVHLTRLWVENTTDSSWPVSKYDLDVMVPSGGSVSGIGQNIGLAALDSQSYMMKLVSERGNNQKVFLNSVNNDSVYLNLRATPTLIPTGFSTTLVLEVINTGSNKLVNLQAEMDSEVCAGACTYDKVSGPTPTSYDSLDPGDIAIFEWVYTIEGEDNDSITFTASLVNGVDTDTAVVTIQDVDTVENVSVALQSAAIGGEAVVEKSILIFHEEQDPAPTGAYQMMSAEPDAGNDGTLFLSNATGLPLSPISFMTSNGSNAVTIPQGNWNASLWIHGAEDPITTGSPGAPDIKYHMEDGYGVDPDNSIDSSTNSDLTECGGAAGWCSLGPAICDDSWDNRFEIKIDNTKVAGNSDHTNFPVMINVTGSTFTTYLDDFDDAINDIRFTSAAGALLDYEIEKYDKTDDELFAWVEVPTLDYNEDTIIYMYFDNAGSPTDQQNAVGVWDSNFKGVWHLDHTSGTALDSTSNNNDGTENISPDSNMDFTGVADGADDFDGSNDWIDIGDTTSMDGATVATFEAWINVDAWGSDAILRKWYAGGQSFIFGLRGTDELQLTVRDSGGGQLNTETTNANLSTNTWYHVVGVWGGGNTRSIIIDGTIKPTLNDITSGNPSSIQNSAERLGIGARYNGGSPDNFFDGTIDEVRMSDVARSDGWIETTYNSINSPSTFYSLTLEGGVGNPPQWHSDQGPHGSGTYQYDASNSECHRTVQDVSAANNNDVGATDATTSLWFKTVGTVTSEQMLVFSEGLGTYPSSSHYKISLVSPGEVLYEFVSDAGGTTTCQSQNEYDNGAWYNVIGVRDSADSSCDLYIYDVNGILQESRTGTQSGSGNTITHDAGDKMFVGSQQEAGNYFNGYIDDIFHWNTVELNSTHADTIARVNHGTAAHKFEVSIDVHDTNGNWLRNAYNSTDNALPYKDPKHYNQATDDLALGNYNITMADVPEIIITTEERLNFTMSFQQASGTWEPLKMGLKIDDDTLSPQTSYLQIPEPDKAFGSYIRYDKTTPLELYIENVGDDGIYYVYSGTRVSFDNGTHSYASLIDSVNGTDEKLKLNMETDSIYFAPGEIAHMYFFKEPTDQPCQKPGNLCVPGEPERIIPDGTYRMAAWINGYTNQGESFGRSVLLGSTSVN